jgi:hypothetical protein
MTGKDLEEFSKKDILEPHEQFAMRKLRLVLHYGVDFKDITLAFVKTFEKESVKTRQSGSTTPSSSQRRHCRRVSRSGALHWVGNRPTV